MIILLMKYATGNDGQYTQENQFLCKKNKLSS